MKTHIKIGSSGQFTIGIDVSDRTSCYCILDQTGEVSNEGKLQSTPEAYRQQFGGMGRAVIALEAGTHSRWMSALLIECGHEVIVANPRRLRLLTTSDKKNDPQDARTLAEMAWAKPALLSPVRHRSAEAQTRSEPGAGAGSDRRGAHEVDQRGALSGERFRCACAEVRQRAVH
jgi:transposase